MAKRVQMKVEPGRLVPGLFKRLFVPLLFIFMDLLAWETFSQAPVQTNPPAQPPAVAPVPGQAQPAAPAPLITPPLQNPAAEALRIEAEAGNAGAQFKLGMMFASGK